VLFAPEPADQQQRRHHRQAGGQADPDAGAVEAESEGESVKAVTLTRWLNVSAPAVTMAVKRLKRDGLISVASNELPRELTELVRLACSGALAEARALQWKLMPLLDANFIESNPIPVKAALAMMGRIRNVLRLPLVPAQPATSARLRQELAGLNVRLPQ